MTYPGMNDERDICDCSDEYGPCEQHGTVLAVREGASLHTADELALLKVSDCLDCGADLSERDRELHDELSEKLDEETNPHSGVAWFHDADDQERAFDLADRAESALPENLWLIANDGYVIVRIHDDCPLLEN